ncbi:MAG: hypothetical protein MRJ66_06100 [Nitrospira sp.]|nr:hypothetical protein [Nitrospira sp.]
MNGKEPKTDQFMGTIEAETSFGSKSGPSPDSVHPVELSEQGHRLRHTTWWEGQHRRKVDQRRVG